MWTTRNEVPQKKHVELMESILQTGRNRLERNEKVDQPGSSEKETGRHREYSRHEKSG